MNKKQLTSQNFVRTLAIAMANSALYSIHHPQVVQLCKTAQELHETLLADQSAIRMMVINRSLVIDDAPLNASLHQQRLIKAMGNCGVSHIELQQGLTEQELAMLVNWLSATTVRPPPDCTHIRCGSVTVHYSEGVDHEEAKNYGLAKNRGEGSSSGQRSPLEQDYSAEELERFMEIYAAVKNQQQLNMVGLGDMISSFIDTLQFHADPLLALAPLRQIDDYTFVHSTNVCLLNIIQARSLGLEGAQLHDIGIAALLHDVGKQFVPSEILNKPGKLDDDEWCLMQEHPQRGALYLLENPGIPRLAVVTAFEHHMRYDQRGYPLIPVKWSQNLSSQMTAISDVFDALRTSRSYRKAMEPSKIKKIFMEMSGTDLHPGLTTNFLALLDL